MIKLKSYILLFALLAFTCCGGQKGELRIKGHLENSNQMDILIYRLDGKMAGVDTIHVIEGDFDYRTQLNEDATLEIIYPNFSTLTLFGKSGAVLEIEGDAQHLSNVKVSGTRENEEYTSYRLSQDTKTQEQLDSLRDVLIAENPESQLGIYLDKEKRLREIPGMLKIGAGLPNFTLNMRDGRLLKSKDLKGRYVLIAFWANWRNGSSSLLYKARRLKQNAKKPLECICYSLDTTPYLLELNEKRDTIAAYSYCDFRSWQSELVEKFGIRDIPYIILADTKGKVIASGSDWDKDIQKAAEVITKE